MTIILEILLFVTLFAGLYFGASALFATNTNLQTMVGHIGYIFHAIIGNMKNFKEFFPVYDLAIAFGAFLVVESIVFAFKLVNYFIKFKSNSTKK